MQQASFQTEAIILRRTNYGEADRILNLLTPNRGKLSAIAKGVRRPKSKLAGGLELLAVCDVTFMSGRGDMALVTSARLNQFFGNILHDYDRLQLAYEVIKQINRVTQTVSEGEFYQLLKDSLTYLDDPKIDWRLTELWFRLHLAEFLGYALNTAATRDNQPLEPDKTYTFDTTEMLFVPAPNGPYGSDVLKLLRLATRHSPPALQKVGSIDKPLAGALELTRILNV